jgi:Holliday junction resolvasome RuvABC endonuclease subunit
VTDPIKEDFRHFLFLMWQHLRLPPPTPVQNDIARYLQFGPRRRMVEAFRGVGKSWITAAFVLWCLYRNANERVLVVSASKERADAFSVFVKRMIHEWPLLSDLIPEAGMRDSNVAFDVGGSMPHQSPSVRSVGITGQMTGGRASKIIPDDIETPKNSQTQTMRDRLSELVKEFDAILMSEEDLKHLGIDSADIVYLGTPQTEMSLYNQLPTRGYGVRVWPSRFPAKVEDYKGHLAPLVMGAIEADPLISTWNGRGKPVDPARFTDLDLMEREASYGRSGYALQFQLNTSLSDADRYPLKCCDAMVLNVTPALLPTQVAWGSGPTQLRNDVPCVGLSGDKWFMPMFVSEKLMQEPQGCLMAIDPSGRGSDETGYAVIAMLNGFLYVLEAGGLKGGYDDATLTTLAEIAKRCGVKKIWIESNFGDGMFTKLLTTFLTRIYPCSTEEIRSNIQKEKRIVDTLEPVFNQHRILFTEAVIKKDLETEDVKYQLFHQLTRITREKGSLAKDDRLDALAMAVAAWVEIMDQDATHAIDARKAELLDQELEQFAQGVLGWEPKGNLWMDIGSP